MTPAVALGQQTRVPERLGFLWPLPVALWFLIAAFLPATLTPQFVFWDIPVSGYDAALLIAALCGFAMFLCSDASGARAGNWHRNLHWWLAAILIYAAFSLGWSGLDTSNARAMFYTLVMAAAAFLLPFSLIAGLTPERVRSLLRLATYGLAAAAAVYSLQSFFSMGWRSELGQFYSVGFGIERVKGPLFQASTGHIILLPAAAFILQDFIDSKANRLPKIAVGIILAIAILGLGSRAAVALMAVTVAGVILVARGVHHRVLIALFLLVGIAAVAGIVFAYASAERLYSFADPRRMATHLTAVNALLNRDFGMLLRGSGYGSFWPWYLPDMELGDLIVRGSDMRSLEYGESLYQPHSVLLVLTVELGLAGILFFIRIWATMAELIVSAWRGSRESIFHIGVAVTSFAMFADLIIFKNPKVSAFWWFYVLAALAMSVRRSNQMVALP